MKKAIDVPRRLARLLLLGLVGIAGIGSILATSVPGEPFQSTTESFLLVYTGEDGKLRARASQTGLDWRDASDNIGPNGTATNIMLFSGIPDAWIAAGADRWFKASARPDGKLELNWREPWDVPVPLEHPLYTKLVGQPAAALFGEKLVIAWLRGKGPRYDLVTVTGKVAGDQIELADPVVFKRGALRAAAEAMAGGVTFKDGVVAGPALSHGLGESFLMAVVRETWEDVQARNRGEESPVRYRVAIYESENGRDWWMHSTVHDSEMPVGPGSVVAIAGFTDSTAIVVAVSGDEGEPARVAVARYCFGPLWYEQDAQAVFGGRPLANQPIALLSIGEPKPIPPGDYLDCVEN